MNQQTKVPNTKPKLTQMKDKISNKYENLDILNLKPTSPKENKCLDKSKKEKIRIPRKKEIPKPDYEQETLSSRRQNQNHQSQ